MFDGAADVILDRLANAAEAVGRALGDALENLAEKVKDILRISFIAGGTETFFILYRSKSVSLFSGRAPTVPTPDKLESALKSCRS